MPHSRENRPEKHFASYNLGDQSFFTSGFPVPKDVPGVNQIVSKSLPNLMDTIFVAKSGTRTHETGAVPLQPISAKMQFENYHRGDHILRSRHFTLGALTEGINLRSFILQIDQNSSQVDSFSLVIQAGPNEERKFELRGFIDSEDEDSIYEFATYNNDEQEETVLVDELVARDIVLALCELHEAAPLLNQSLESSLLSALGSADKVDVKESGIYIPEDGGRVELALEREQTIKRGLARTTFMSVLLIDTLATPLATTKRSFKYVHDASQQPVNSASLSYLVTSHDDEYAHEHRESTFETESVVFRANPIMLYQAAEKAMSDLVSEPL